MTNTNYEWKYCGTCDVMIIICPHCGNNTCSGGGTDCCEDSYNALKKAHGTNSVPDKPDNWRQLKEEANQFLNNLSI